jgi:hypothetical protein
MPAAKPAHKHNESVNFFIIQPPKLPAHLERPGYALAAA